MTRLQYIDPGDPNIQKSLDFWVQDYSAASGILLAAYGQGLGEVRIGVYPA